MHDSATIELAPGLRICRVLNGLWQVSGAHGVIDPARALPEMRRYHESGFTTWDLADHYGPAEDFVGAFRQSLAAEAGEAALAQMQALTKWVPRPGPMTRAVVEAAVDVSRRRMRAPALDMLQFHWWAYDDRRYLDALRHLADLRAEGRLRHIGLTNFDSERLALILDAGIPVVSNQVQFSLIDARPLARMAALCAKRGVALLAYGTVAGGLFDERWLGAVQPGRAALNTASLRKYVGMIEAWGGWAAFQRLLAETVAIARAHATTPAVVAARWVLEQPQVAGVIIGARLGVSEHRADSARMLSLRLTADDHARLNEARAGHDLMRVIGDCGDEYR